MLRTNLEFVQLEAPTRCIMVTSAVEAEGKSTTAANLAVTLARGGKRVVLVDFDLRRPFLDRFFPAGKHPGLTNVALGYASLDQALIKVPLVERKEVGWKNGSNGNGSARVDGLLEVLTSGPVPPNVDDFVGTKAVADILEALKHRADVVVVDATPLLVVGDAMSLATAVDAMLVVTRIKVVRRPMLKELRRVLDAVPARKLGFVLTGANQEESYGGYGAYSYRYHSHETRAREAIS
jgi:Mrp family chromosome partitioning ATPase